MAKILQGDTLEDFSFDTPFEQNKTLSELLNKVEGKTALLFLRYYGCTLCQMDIHNLIKDYDEIKKINSQIIVVFQSKPESISSNVKSEDLPFEIICDPEQTLYIKYDIKPATSQAKMVDAKTLAKVAKATMGGFKHGEYEGNELQLPATVILDKNRVVDYVHYGTSVGDTPSIDELVTLLTK